MAAPRSNVDRSAALRRKLADLPTQPGVYLYRDQEGNLLYVGKAKVLRNRVKSYFQAKQLDAKTRRLVARVWDLEFVVCETELEALVLENNFIKEHRPPYNILLRDDKTYPYVKLTWKNAFPQVFVTRKVKKDGSLYYGPFFPASTAYRTAELVYRFFQVRDCDIDIDGRRGRACLKYQLHRCTAPCIGAVDQAGYREQARSAKLFLDGRRDELKARLEAAMWQAAGRSAFELAAQDPGRPAAAGRLVRTARRPPPWTRRTRTCTAARCWTAAPACTAWSCGTGAWWGAGSTSWTTWRSSTAPCWPRCSSGSTPRRRCRPGSWWSRSPRTWTCCGSGWGACGGPARPSTCPSGVRRWNCSPWPRRTPAWPWSASSSRPGSTRRCWRGCRASWAWPGRPGASSASTSATGRGGRWWPPAWCSATASRTVAATAGSSSPTSTTTTSPTWRRW